MDAPIFPPIILPREISGAGDLELCVTSAVSWISQHFSSFPPEQQMDALIWVACRMPTNLTNAQQNDITDEIASLFVHMSPIQFRHIRYNFPPAIETPLILRHTSLLSDFLVYQLPRIPFETVFEAIKDFVKSELADVQPLERQALLFEVDMCLRHRQERETIKRMFEDVFYGYPSDNETLTEILAHLRTTPPFNTAQLMHIYPVLHLLPQPTRMAWLNTTMFPEEYSAQPSSSEVRTVDQGMLLALIATLWSTNKQMIKMLIGTGPIRLQSIKPLQQNTEDLKRIEGLLDPLNVGEVSEDEYADVFETIRVAGGRLLDAEALLIKHEAAALAEGKLFVYAASLWERSRYRAAMRHCTKNYPAHLQLKWRESVTLPERVHHEHRHELTCGICCDEIEDSGKSIAVTHKCCAKPLHVSCLLEWLYTQCETGAHSCPCCRTGLDSDFLAEVMLMAVQEMMVL
jgi:hypothetical protein